ncbi:MAG: hypothetical protein QXU32_04975 [Nitrososphaerales archaeon]
MNTRIIVDAFLITSVIILASTTMNNSILDALGQQPKHPAFHGTKTVAGFHVELTVDPTPIEPNVITKFGTRFMDATTGELASKVPHTLVLMRDGEMIFRESTDSASYLHEFSFMEEHQGPLTVLIENVNNSGENADFSLMIVPEFPLGVMFIMGSMLAIMFVILRVRGFHGKP